ncbi:MAG: HAMP domain-containing sensor histidine kinase [Clostridium sp.]
MKLKNKLFLNFGTLVFVTLNIFGSILIQSNFHDSLEHLINTSLGEYSVIYNNIKTGEDLNNLFLTNKDIIQIKSEYYLKNINNPDISFEFRDLNMNPLYSTEDIFFDVPPELFTFVTEDSNYMIVTKDIDHFLIINNVISINKEDFYFTYVSDFNYLFESKLNNYLSLFKLNILVGIILLIIIYLIAVDITKPISLLIGNIDDIINGNFIKKLDYTSNIEELNSISTNFNLMNDEIQNKISLLKEQNDSKQRFIDNLTHEIRTPLTSIIGYSRLMIDKNVQDVALLHKSFEQVNKEGNRILSLTSNLVKLITLDKISLNITSIRLIDLLNSIKNTFDIRMKDSNIEFIIEGSDIEIKTDIDLFTILIFNFIDNAIKAINSIELTDSKKVILIKLNKNTLEVIDNGVGISKEDLNKILEPFYMVDKSRTRSLNGFGLGLCICQEIIKILNMEFDIESTLGHGTKVSLLFNKESVI